MKRFVSVYQLVLPLLALASAHCLVAQTLVVDKSALAFSSQVGGTAANQTINFTSSNGSPISFTLSAPASPWIKFNGQPLGTGGLTTPAAVIVSVDSSGFGAGVTSASITVQSSSGVVPSIGVTLTVSAIGVSPASLTFTYTLLSTTFPAAQSLTLSGAAAQCTATPNPISGGNWFTLLQSSCASPGTVGVLINSAVVAGLAPNTYTGTVTITPAGQGPGVIVPLTLLVLPTPPVTVNPTELVFNWQTGLAGPNPQTFTISTTSLQPLNYSISTSVDNSPSKWLSVSPTSGTFTGSIPITVSVSASSLAVGTYTGHIALNTSGATPPQTDITVTLNVSNSPLLNVPNATLNFSYQLGTAAPAAQAVNILATSGTILYTVIPSANSPWLKVLTAQSTPAPLSVAVNPAGLVPGTYSATLSIQHNTAESPPQKIAVVLKVTNDPVLSVSVATLNFPYQIGPAAPSARNVRITSSTGVPLNYTAALATTTCSAFTWLQATNINNSLSGVTDDTLRVSVATAGLPAGTCSGTLTINATNPATGAAAVGSPFPITVTLTVSTTSQLMVTPADPVVFSVGVSAPSPTPQTVTLTSTDSVVLNYSVDFQPQSSWLSVNGRTGSTPAPNQTAPNNTITISASPAGLAAGVYSGSVTITASVPGGAVPNSPVSIPVTLNVIAGSLTLSATSIAFPDQTLGGPASPAQTVTVGSSSTQPLIYTAVANSNNAVSWLSVSPASGSTATSGVLTVAVDASRLTPGTYSGTIVVSSPGAANTPQTINVSFKLNPSTLSAPTAPLTFTQLVGGAAPAPQSIVVSGSPASLNFAITAATLSGANWLSATPVSGTTPTTVQVSVNGAALPVGQYTGTVTITSTGASGSPITVGVVLNVIPSAVMAASPTSLAFTYILGQPVPPAQNVSVTAAGASGNVPIAMQVQFDGNAGQWLIVSPTTSNAPATLVVSVSPSTLAAGQYNGRVTITSPNALATVTVPVTLTVTAIPQPVVSAVANAANYSTGAVSPGENIVIFGTGIGPATLVSGTVANNAFTTTAGNTRVLFDNVPAPIIYSSARQTSVMVPYGVVGRNTTNIVVEFFGVQSASLTYNVAVAVPGVYTLNTQGTGPGAILNQDGLTTNGAGTPEKRGNVIAIYMTGEGQTSPQGVDGAIIPAVASALKKPQLPVTVTIGGVDAVVQYAGSAPGLVSGVMQVNVTIPLTAPTGGAVPVVVTVGTAKTQSGDSAATVAVQ